MIAKIITHAGTFHADEILSIALLRCMGIMAPIERTYTPSDEDFYNPAIFVLDVGRRYEPERNNFDHHQNGDLAATNLLLLETLGRPYFGNAVCDRLHDSLFSRVSDIDRGKIGLTGSEGFLEFNSIIRPFK